MKAKNSQACVAEVQKAHKGLGQSLSELESGGQRPLTAHSKALLTTHLEHSPPLRRPALSPASSPHPPSCRTPNLLSQTPLLSFLCHLAFPPWISRSTSRTTAAVAAERTSPTLKRSVKPKVKKSQQTLSLPTKKLAVSAQEALRRKRAPTRARSSSSSTAFTSLFSRRKGLDHAHLHRINAAQAHTPVHRVRASPSPASRSPTTPLMT